MNRTPIEWVQAPGGGPGYTWNPIVGCSKGCPYCYARRFAKRNQRRCARCGTFEPHLHEERLDQVTPGQKPRGIFVCSMGEIADPALPEKATRAVMSRALTTGHHRYYILTKRPGLLVERLHGGSDDPYFRQWGPRWHSSASHIWVGTSVSTQREADERVPELLRLREHGDWPVLFVSVEPLLGPVDLGEWLCRIALSRQGITRAGLDWAILGAQTGPGAVRPKPEWIVSIERQCLGAGLPLFEKANLHKSDLGIGREKQEMPDG